MIGPIAMCFTARQPCKVRLDKVYAHRQCHCQLYKHAHAQCSTHHTTATITTAQLHPNHGAPSGYCVMCTVTRFSVVIPAAVRRAVCRYDSCATRTEHTWHDTNITHTYHTPCAYIVRAVVCRTYHSVVADGVRVLPIISLCMHSLSYSSPSSRWFVPVCARYVACSMCCDHRLR